MYQGLSEAAKKKKKKGDISWIACTSPQSSGTTTYKKITSNTSLLVTRLVNINFGIMESFICHVGVTWWYLDYKSMLANPAPKLLGRHPSNAW